MRCRGHREGIPGLDFSVTQQQRNLRNIFLIYNFGDLEIPEIVFRFRRIRPRENMDREMEDEAAQPAPAAERAADGKRAGKKKKRKTQNNKFTNALAGAHIEGEDEASGSHSARKAAVRRPDDGGGGSEGEAAKKQKARKKVCWVF